MKTVQYLKDSDNVILLEADDVQAKSNESECDEPTSPDSDDQLMNALKQNGQKRQKEATTAYVWICAAMAALGGVLFGYDVGIISGALVLLRCDFDLSKTEESLTVSVMLIGAMIASLTGGFVIDAIGRRLAIIINAVIFVVGASILAASKTYGMLIFGRLIVGFGVSLSAIGECIYISEISPPHRRGALVSLNEFGITVGFLLAYAINLAFINVDEGWRYMFGLSVVPAAIQGIVMIFLPPSPRYLLLKYHDTEAKEVLQKLRGRLDVETELDSIRGVIIQEKTYSLFDICRQAGGMRYRLFIAVSLVLLQQFTGQPNVLYYATTIFEQVGFSSDSSAARVTLILGLTKVVSTVISLLLIDKAGRRRFLLFGATGMMLAIGAMGITLTDVGIPEKNETSCLISNITKNETGTGVELSALVRVVSLISLLLYVSCYAFSFGPVTWLILSEIFPVEFRGRAVAISTVANWGGNLIVSSTFLQLLKSIGIAATFLSYAFICLCSIAFIFTFVPETKGRTLEDIGKELAEGGPSLKSRCAALRHKVRSNGKKET
ncbi:solute carrier family 2, facilitated glucose transporter member 10-like [Oscarella lobularis]|uniref:solute carrier family 2, facilitated glucose transporter member 10-like n=1 Tax=Oscarella lobularis TaxID=121494 RepID=UPI0033135406